jgi:hypothetical protein
MKAYNMYVLQFLSPYKNFRTYGHNLTEFDANIMTLETRSTLYFSVSYQ